jgi:CRISPR-associated protein Csx10
MTRAITYTLWLEEPCLLTKPGGDPNTESSLDYIPGGAVRGALAAAYLRSGGEEAQFAPLFLSGRARFLNAYPMVDGRTLPASRAWATKKDDETTVYNRLDETARGEVEDDLPQGFKAAFVQLTPDTPHIRTVTIDHEIAVHTARNRLKGRAIEGDADSALFRYRALARGQRFAGAIVLDDALPPDDVARLEKLLTGGVLPLGGSHTAGYGLVRVEGVPQTNTWREADGLPPDVAVGSSFVVTLTSDAILYHPRTGQPTSDILLFLPGGPDGYKLLDSYAAMTWVGGFNKHRGLPLSQQWAVQMGSTWRVTTGRALATRELAALEESGIGVRREEGFGRVLFNPRWPAKLFKLEDELKSGETRPAAAATPTGTAVSAALLKQMNARIARRELDRRLAVAVNAKARGEVRGHLSRSQFGRLMVRIRREADTTNFEGFVDYLKGTSQRKSADDQFRKYSVEGKNFRDLLRELAGEPRSIWRLIDPQGAEIPRIGEDAYDFQDELAHDYTVRYISDLCRQLAKREVRQ